MEITGTHSVVQVSRAEVSSGLWAFLLWSEGMAVAVSPVMSTFQGAQTMKDKE